MLAVLVVALVLGVTGVVLVRLHERELIANLDHSLEQRADQVLASLLADAGDAFASSNAEDRLAQLVAADGSTVGGTSNLGGVAVVAPIPEGELAAFTTADLPLEDDAYRLWVRGVRTGEGVQTLVVGENIDDLNDSVRTLEVLLLTIVPLVVVVLGALVWWLVGWTLRPVEAIRRRVASIELDRLAERVPDPGTEDEIARLASTMNAMLDRLDEASARQRRFVADASHELRSPLTRIRTTLEVDLAAPDADLVQTCDQALDATIAMQAMVDDLLYLARRDAGPAPERFSPVDLDVVVDAEVQQIRTHTLLDIDQSAVSAAVVSGSRQQLRRMVANLLDNAVRYAEHRVLVALEEVGDRAVLVFEDDGPGIDPADRDRVFGRFTRLDDARASTTGGTGLGLAIVHDIVSTHGGHIVIEDAASGGARIVVELPIQ